MKVVLTTDVQADAAVKEALSPDPLEQRSFEDLWAKAQETLTILGKSRFARRYLLAKIAHSPRSDLGMNLNYTLHAPELLFLSYDSDREHGFYLRCVKNGATFKGPFGEHFINETKVWLKAMLTPTGALRALFDLFDPPDFTEADIDAEAVRNGSLMVTVIGIARSADRIIGNRGMDWRLAEEEKDERLSLSVGQRLTELQFSVMTRHINYLDALAHLSKLPKVPGEQIVIIHLRWEARQEINALYAQLPAELKKRVWFYTQFPDSNVYTIDRSSRTGDATFDASLFNNGTVAERLDQTNEQLAAFLTAMFSD